MVPLPVAGHPKRSEQTGVGGRAGMIPALIISVPPYMTAAAHSLCRPAAKHRGQRHSEPLRTKAARSEEPAHRGSTGQDTVPSTSPGLQGEGQEVPAWGAPGQDTRSCPPSSSLLAHTQPDVTSPQARQTHPRQASSQGVKVPCYSFHTWVPLICRLNFPEAKAFTRGSAVEPCYYRLQVP